MAKEETKKKNLHAGHRKRMREEYEAKGFEDKPEHIVLEYMLNLALPRVNTNDIAHELINKCGGFANVFRASKKQLTDVYGVGDKVAEYLQMLGEFVHYYNGKRFEINRKTLDSSNCEQYLLDIFDGKSREHFYVICLDSNNRVISKADMSQGTFDRIDINVQEIVRYALTCDAAYVVLAHNHPSGILEASNADVVSTQSIQRILQICDIKLYDHIIVANGKCKSMRNAGLLEPRRPERKNNGKISG